MSRGCTENTYSGSSSTAVAVRSTSSAYARPLAGERDRPGWRPGAVHPPEEGALSNDGGGGRAGHRIFSGITYMKEKGRWIHGLS